MTRYAIVNCLLVISANIAVSAEPAWVKPMRAVHDRFTGESGTLALFGDSITDSLAFWAPLSYAPKTGLPAEMADALKLVTAHQNDACWRKWRGSDYGNQSGQRIAWAAKNVDNWLRKLNPEVAVLMFGTNDLGRLDAKQYETDTRTVIQRCLKNGTIVIMTTIPPRSGAVEQSKEFADVQRKLAVEFGLPLIDYQAEILARRPNDWDGTLPKFKPYTDGVYDVPTLIAGDGVHPSNPKAFGDYSAKALNHNGFQLRNVLTLMTYADVIDKVIK